MTILPGDKVMCLTVPPDWKGLFSPMPKRGWTYLVRETKYLNHDGELMPGLRLEGVKGKTGKRGKEYWLQAGCFVGLLYVQAANQINRERRVK